MHNTGVDKTDNENFSYLFFKSTLVNVITTGEMPLLFVRSAVTYLATMHN